MVYRVLNFLNVVTSVWIVGLPFNYIDPGSGSAILSAIVGFFVVIGLTIKSFWYKIKSVFSRSSRDENDES